MKYLLKRLRYACGLFLLLCGAAALHAQQQSLMLQWRPVGGAYGYILEVRDSSGKVETLRVKSNRAELKLGAGMYSIRLAGLNKFRRPGAWSDWRDFTVAPVSAGSTENSSTALNLDRMPTKGTTPPPAEKKTSPHPPAGKSLLSPVNFLPGVPQLRSERPLTGSLLGGALLAAGSFAYSRNAFAATLAQDQANQPTLWIAALWNTTSDQILLPGLLVRQRLYDNQASYETARQQTRLGLGLMALIYAAHWLDLYYVAPQTGSAFAPKRPVLVDVALEREPIALSRSSAADGVRFTVSVGARF